MHTNNSHSKTNEHLWHSCLPTLHAARHRRWPQMKLWEAKQRNKEINSKHQARKLIKELHHPTSERASKQLSIPINREIHQGTPSFSALTQNKLQVDAGIEGKSYHSSCSLSKRQLWHEVIEECHFWGLDEALVLHLPASFLPSTPVLKENKIRVSSSLKMTRRRGSESAWARSWQRQLLAAVERWSSEHKPLW